MAVIQVINQTDQINNAFTKVNENFLAVNQGLINVSTGHDHDGVNSKTVDHTKLINIGVNTHSVIDTAINNLTSHLGNTDLHVSSEEQTAWDNVVTEVINARNSAAKSTIYDNLDARLEAIESDTAPSAHDSMSGRHTPATDNTDNGSRHKAAAIYDDTGERTVQEALDNLEGDVSDLSTDKANKATIIAEINATSEVTLIQKEHVEQPTIADSEVNAGNFTVILPSGDTPASTRLRTSVNIVSPILRNLIWNGVFTYLGGDPDNTRNLTKTPQADKNYPFTIPGWKVTTTSTTSYVKIEDVAGTPPWHDYKANDIYRNIFGYKQLTFKHSGDGVGFTLQSASIPLTEANAVPRFTTVSLWYKTSTAYALPPFNLMLGGNGLDLVSPTNDTNWHHYSRSVPVSANLAPLIINFNANVGVPEVSIARIAVWDAILTSDVHLNPLAWYNPLFLPYNEGATSVISDTAPTANELFKNTPEFKKTWRAEIPVDTSLSSPITIPIPPTHYIYNVRVFSDYHITVPIPTTPPTSVDTWYAHADLSANYTAPINSLSLYVPVPPTNNNRIIVEVDYWPAENS